MDLFFCIWLVMSPEKKRVKHAKQQWESDSTSFDSRLIEDSLQVPIYIPDLGHDD